MYENGISSSVISYIQNYKDFDKFYTEHRRHFHSRHTLQSYFNIYEVDPQDKILFQYYAAITCHYCDTHFVLEYDHQTKLDLLKVLQKYGVNDWEIVSSA